MSAESCRWIQSFGSGPVGQNHSQVSRKQKYREKQCRSWDFQYTLHTIVLGEEGVTTHEKVNLCTKHLHTRLGYRKPHTVHSVTLNFKSVLMRLPDVSPLIQLPFARCKPFDPDNSSLDPSRLGAAPRGLPASPAIRRLPWCPRPATLLHQLLLLLPIRHCAFPGIVQAPRQYNNVILCLIVLKPLKGGKLDYEEKEQRNFHAVTRQSKSRDAGQAAQINHQCQWEVLFHAIKQ